jgi:hypothetical protein
MTSVGPPAVNGTTSRMLCAGNRSCADALAPENPAKADIAARNRRRSIMVILTH